MPNLSKVIKDLSEKFSYHERTTNQALWLLDQVMPQLRANLSVHEYGAVACSCLSVAAKFEELWKPNRRSFVSCAYDMGFSFTLENLNTVESQICNILEWNLHPLFN